MRCSHRGGGGKREFGRWRKGVQEWLSDFEVIPYDVPILRCDDGGSFSFLGS